MPNDSPHKIIFRLHRTESDGSSTVEEREVQCDETSLASLLTEPWETRPEVQDPSLRVNELSDVVAKALRRLSLHIRRKMHDDGDTWFVGFDSPGETETQLINNSVQEVTNGPVKVSARSETSTSAVDGTVTSGQNQIHIENQGLSVISYGNLSAIINLVLEVHLDLGKCDRPYEHYKNNRHQ